MDTIYSLSLIIIILTIIIRFKSYTKRLNIPGPKGLPIIGNIHQMKPLPHEKFYDWYLQFGNIYYIKFGSINTVVLSEPDVIKEAFLDHSDAFSKRFIRNSRKATSNKTNLASSNGENWKKTRRIISLGMTTTKLKDFQLPLNEETENLSKFMDENCVDKETNIGDVIAIYALNNISRITMSDTNPYNIDGEVVGFTKKINRYFVLLGTPFPGDFINIAYPFFKNKPKEFYDLYVEILKFVQDKVDEREDTLDVDNPKDIMESLMVEHRRDKEATFNVAATCIDLFTAGSDTTSSTITYLIREMCNNPHIQDKLYNELKTVVSINEEVHFKDLRTQTPYLNACINEVKRRYPTAPLGVPHKTSKDVEFRGYKITKGTQILSNIYATHLSPKLWQCPRDFDPNRFLGKDATDNIAKLAIFNFGIRNCVGLNLADMELFTAIAMLFRRFKFSRTTTLPIPEGDVFGLTMKPLPFKCLVEKRV